NESTTSELAGYTTSNDITSDMDTEINNNIITTSLSNIENQTILTFNSSKPNLTLHDKCADNLNLHSSIHNPENWNPKNQHQQISSSEWEI
ncbi:2811_t:CDS:1, partial [Ambispora gerdemannii]